ncbi:MAG: T9SS type A sorting domain-containing protein [candidate division Zixibacteria bacterium]|nr:T9SS type A sorting domain-containing protein [candidate division Zixibacteria bacterium]
MKSNTITCLLAIFYVVAGSVHAETINYVSSALWTDANEVRVAGEYAYCDFDNGLLILDIAEPSTPTLVSQMPLGGNQRKLCVSGDYLYIANDIYGLQVVDIADPENPVLLYSYSTEHEAIGISIFEGHAFVTTTWDDESTGDDYSEMLIYDLSNPAEPEQIGQFSAYFSLPFTDVFATDSLIFATYGGSRLIEGYDITFGGLAVFDMNDISNPAMIGDYQTHEAGFNSVFADNEHAFVANSGKGLQIFNVQYLGTIFLESEHSTPGTAWDISVAGNYAFIADAGEGIQVFDITDTGSPELTANYQDGHYILNFDIANDYVFTSSRTSVRIIDISEPFNAFLAGSITTPYAVDHVSVSGNLAGVSLDNSGFQLIDIADPYNPVMAGHSDVSDRVHASFLDGDFAYVVDFSSGFQIFDISYPDNPVLEGALYLNGETHDLYIAGDYAYIASGLDGLRILDISNREQPEVIGSFDYQGYAKGVCVSGNYAYATADAFGLRIINIADPSSPQLVSTIETPGRASQVCVSGDYAYVADGYNGDLLIIDITNPAFPDLAGSFDVQGGSVYDVTVSDNFAFVATGDLQVIDISDSENPVYVAGYNTPGFVQNIFVADNYIYIADDASLMILHFDPQTGIISDTSVLPGQYSIAQNYPNPFNASTTITYRLTETGHISVEIFDLLGRKIETLVDSRQSAGNHQVAWNASNQTSGIYFYKIRGGGLSERKKMILLK